MKIKLDGTKMPTRAHEADAGLDLYSREKAIIYPHESHIFDTGVHVELPKNSVGQIPLRCFRCAFRSQDCIPRNHQEES